MNYYYAKIGMANSLADDFLSGKGVSPILSPSIPIFFGKTTVEQFKNGDPKAREQGRNFVWCGQKDNWNNATIIVLHEGVLHFLKPNGYIETHDWNDENSDDKSTVKVLPIVEIKKSSIVDVPAILSGISANRYLNSGTFRQIKPQTRFGNIKAIEFVLNGIVDMNDNWSFEDMLKCLSSVELETLVAKIFEEAGCFVPAYRGGALQYADIIAKNDMDTEISINGFKIPPNAGISIQVKTNNQKKQPPRGVDYLIGIGLNQSAKVYSSDWIYQSLKELRETSAWLKRSLSWLPMSDE